MPVSLEKKLEKARRKRDLSVFDVLSIDDLSMQDIELILKIAILFKEAETAKLSLLKDSTIITAFYEQSTRTRLSFELAGKHLGADVVGTSAESSSLRKGESLLDTMLTLAALKPKVIVMRSTDAGSQCFVAQHVPCAVVSAGDGWHEHPTQGLLDAKTMLDHHGNMEKKVLTIIGDTLHSRVFGSLVRVAKKLGAKVRIASPCTFIAQGVEEFGVEIFTNVEKALAGAHVICALRVQEERGSTGFIPSLQEYAKMYCMTSERLALADKNAILIHPGPVIRGVDVASDLVCHPQSKIREQVTNGLAVRKAVLWLLAKRYDKKTKPFSPA
ncbi:aspartate carbamoyltransferase catalytic subunit [Candidatus Peregrinibacteria bacterium]|nr:aspartate carbamoyltransferase catalytic subunit [Candidatus Peregrinibacteria bacterium]